MELIRLLATLAEPPTERTAQFVDLLGLAPAPSRAAHTDVFVLQLTPYASVYLSEDGMIGGEPQDRIAGFWRALGLTSPFEPDHLATLLGMYATLCERSEMEGPGRSSDAPMRARHAFLWEHLLTWVPLYLRAVGCDAPEPYPDWAKLLVDVLIEEAREHGAPAVMPLHLREVAGLADPRGEGLQQFLDNLLTPIRSGLILTHSDLARAARSFGAGLRAGPRKMVLRSLIEQDAGALLEWVSQEAHAWHAFHRTLMDPLGPVADFWAGQASKTAALVDSLTPEASEISQG